MANSWLRLWHDMPNDPKWRTIAKISGQPIALVQAVYLQLLVSASQNPVTDETGITLHIVTVTTEDIASSLDVTERNVISVTDAMQGRVLAGNTISGWNKRQSPSINHRNPGKPAKTGAQRVKEFRERKKIKESSAGDVTTGNVTETLGNDVTPQIRKEEIRKEVKDKNKKHMSDSEKQPNQTQHSGDKKYPDEFEVLWREYPKRSGGQGKAGALKAWRARCREGILPETMLEAVRRYTAYCKGKSIVGTEFVRLAQTFLGTNHEFDNPWEINSGGGNHGQNIPGAGRTAAGAVRAERERWEQQQAEHSGSERVETLGDAGGNLWEPLGNEEWVKTVNAVGGSNFEDDQ